MSFDANIGRPQPAIKPAASMNNDGGSGGNTGYMMRGRKKDKKNTDNIFSAEASLDIDSFQLSSGIPKLDDFSIGYEGSWFDKFIDKFFIL